MNLMAKIFFLGVHGHWGFLLSTGLNNCEMEPTGFLDFSEYGVTDQVVLTFGTRRHRRLAL